MLWEHAKLSVSSWKFWLKQQQQTKMLGLLKTWDLYKDPWKPHNSCKTDEICYADFWKEMSHGRHTEIHESDGLHTQLINKILCLLFLWDHPHCRNWSEAPNQFKCYSTPWFLQHIYLYVWHQVWLQSLTQWPLLSISDLSSDGINTLSFNFMQEKKKKKAEKCCWKGVVNDKIRFPVNTNSFKVARMWADWKIAGAI